MTSKLNINWSDWFLYDENSPTYLTNKVDRLGGKDFESPVAVAGAVSGCTVDGGYSKVGLFNRVYQTHRIVWELHNGSLADDYVIDHINGCRWDNRIENLRAVTVKQNQRNRRMPNTNSSGVVGVRLFETEKRSKLYSYWRAFWNDSETGKYTCKDFSIEKLGYDAAFALACSYRAEKIYEMNQKGAGYSDRHGKE